MSNKSGNEASIYIRLDTYTYPVIFPTDKYGDEYKYNIPTTPLPDEEQETLETLISSDPLRRLEPEEVAILWKNRFHLLKRPEALPKFLLSARWNVLDDVVEVKKLMKVWEPIAPESAIELLDSYFADLDVRTYAVERLELLTDNQVMDFLLQLVQVCSSNQLLFVFDNG